jgi:hypothetical protein
MYKCLEIPGFSCDDVESLGTATIMNTSNSWKTVSFRENYVQQIIILKLIFHSELELQ